MATRLLAKRQSTLSFSVHLVCRPRTTAQVGDGRDVLAELPKRIHQWMPRLASEGVVGADAVFACLGPALEIFSRYTRVEKASGDQVTLKDYLEQVWAAVSQEALSMIFAGADASGFDPDARLTAMWFWTLGSGESLSVGTGTAEAGVDTDVARIVSKVGPLEQVVQRVGRADRDQTTPPSSPRDDNNTEETSAEDDEQAGRPAKTNGFVLEYDAVRKIAQGLGAHLEQLTSVVEVKGD